MTKFVVASKTALQLLFNKVKIKKAVLKKGSGIVSKFSLIFLKGRK